MSDKTVTLRFSAWSNISYHYEYDTDISAEEWAEMSDEEKFKVANEAIWEDVEYTEVEVS